MARLPRLVVPGQPLHIIHRGNNRQAVFFGEDDYHRFLSDLTQATGKYRCAVHAYERRVTQLQHGGDRKSKAYRGGGIKNRIKYSDPLVHSLVRRIAHALNTHNERNPRPSRGSASEYKLKGFFLSGRSILAALRRDSSIARASLSPITHYSSPLSRLESPRPIAPLPPVLLRLAGKLTGKSATVDRLLSSLAVDSSKILRELDLTPPFSMDQGLKLTSKWFKKKL